MNQPKDNKRKFTYFEEKRVFADLKKMASAETEKRGQVVTVPELIREVTLKKVNAIRLRNGQKPIDYDHSAGKYAAGGVESAAQAVVYLNEKLEVSDRRGKRLSDFKTVKDIPRLLSLYPKCKITYSR